MEEESQAMAYADIDFISVNQGFVAGVLESFAVPRNAGVLDLGCGPADIPIRLLHTRPDLTIHGIVASAPMLDCGLKERGRPGPGNALVLRNERLPLGTSAQAFDLIESKSLVHHLPDRDGLWREVLRQSRSGTQIYRMDLKRPPRVDAAKALVETCSGAEPPLLNHDFFHSLLAAFRPEEVETLLRDAGIHTLQVQEPPYRHLLISGGL
jgi:SAM-dependent methyltransferase